MKAKENFENIKQRLVDNIFNQLYENSQPKEYEVIDECEDEICILQPFMFVDGEKMLKIWTRKNDYILSK